MDIISFRDRLELLMDELNLSRADISRDFHISISSVNHWLDGFSEPHPALAKIILTVLEEEI